MKVLEIKNSLVKIAYDTADSLVLSGFVVIEDENMPYVAQVVNLKADVNSNFAIVKLLFTFDEEGILKSYNGSIPSLKATVSHLPSNELLDILPVQNPIKLGELAQQNISLKLDKNLFDGNLLVCSNKQENTNILINNFIKQFEPIQQKTVVFDTDSEFDYERKIIFGQDFKLPLNYDTINFIYENDLEDVDATSKAIIQDIFIEVQEYTKTLPEGFIPFNSFLSVVDAQYKETGITQLVLLKNKLLKYRDENVFAETLKDIMNLSIAIEKTDTCVLDISSVSPTLQREIIAYTYEVMAKIKAPIYSFVKLGNSNANKKLLKRFIVKDNISTTVICPHEFKYIAELKEVADNIIFFTPLTLQHDFSSYNTFLNKLNPDEFIVSGNLTQNIPLVVQLEDLDLTKEEEPETEQEEEVIEETEVEEIVEEEVNEDELLEQILLEEAPTEKVLINQIPLTQNISEPIIEEIDEEPIINEVLLEEPLSSNFEVQEETVFEEEIENLEPEILIEDDEDIIIETIEEDNEDIIQQVAKDVDQILYNKAEPEAVIEEDFSTDELTEDDLNLIDNLVVESPEEEIVEEQIEETSFESNDFLEVEEEALPVVPIYPANDIEQLASLTFEQGEAVSHPKYGRGVVEKMIKYGNKTLCSINFEHIGRRLLDPAISEITKL